MSNRLFCNREALLPATRIRSALGHWLLYFASVVLLWSVFSSASIAADAPAWMHAAASAPVPAHDDKTDAVSLYAEDVTIVQADGKVKSVERRVYKILRPGGRNFGIALAEFDSNRKINSMRGWCIPAQGRDYEVKDKEAVEISLSGIEFSDLITDQKDRLLRIPASDPGNIVGYEIETEEHPYILQGWWNFQEQIPTREARYTLQLPPGWEYKAVWINHPEIAPTSTGSNLWQWVIADVASIRAEKDMPPWRGIAAQMLVSFIPPGNSGKKGFENWAEMGKWEINLEQGRREASPELKQKVAELTSGSSTTLAKMQALSAFVQRDIRYVAIELGIGGWQPHAAKDVFAHRYGDCKDKANLLSAMLAQINVESYPLSINTTRGGVNTATPPHMFWFNHEILGIKLPDDVRDSSLVAIYSHPTLGRVLIFDPTSETTPLGQLSGELQSNYGLLVTPEGGDLIKLPQLPPATSGTTRTGKFKLAADGTLVGDLSEVHRGDSASYQRYRLRAVTKDADRIKFIETELSHSLGTFQITKASIADQKVNTKPLEYMYTFTSPQYAKTAGNLFLVRPRVIGILSSDLLEKKEPRKYPVEFEGPARDEDSYEIELPPGYELDEPSPPTSLDYTFASYHSTVEMKGNVLIYKRTFEIKELSVPVDKLDQLKNLYRTIGSDERNTAVLKPKSS